MRITAGSQVTTADPVLIRWAPRALLVWALGYGALRVVWAAGSGPSAARNGTDLVAFTGWWAVLLCAAAAAICVPVRTTSASRFVVVGGYAVAGAMLVAAAGLLLDLVAILLPGLGPDLDYAAVASRAGMFLGAVLVAASTLGYQRRANGACPRCGRRDDHLASRGTPGWAYAAAYLAVAGCLIRVLAQYLAGFDGIPLNAGASLLLFEVGFVLAGTVLPLALVHSWGRVWPRWVLPLAGRRVPRWLVLGPALGLAGGITAYFGIILAGMLGNVLTGRPAFADPGPFSQAFFWVAVPSYLLWGLGLGAAAIGYLRATRPGCRSCGRGLTKRVEPRRTGEASGRPVQS